MTPEQAADIVVLIKAATASRVDPGTENYYNARLLELDYDLALGAANLGTITWRKFPPWAEFKEIYRSQKRLAEPVGEQRSEIPESPSGAIGEDPPFKRGENAPEWVHVWFWCRIERQPRNVMSFPQQAGSVDPANVMTKEDYEKVRSEWKAAGAPKYEDPIPMAR